MYVAYILFFSPSHFYFPASGQAVVTGVVPPFPRFLSSISIVHRAQQSHCSSIFIRVLLTQALALSASQFVHKKKSPRIYTSYYALGGARTHETDLHFFFFFFFFAHFHFPASGQAVVTGVIPSPPQFLPSILSRIGFSNPTARRLFIECC